MVGCRGKLLLPLISTALMALGCLYYLPSHNKQIYQLIQRCSNDARLDRVHRICEPRGVVSGLSPWQSPHKTRRILVDDQHKVLYCVIPKVGCSSWKHLMVNLSGKRHIGKLQLHGHYINKYGLYYLNTYNPGERRDRLNSYMKFIVVRHPFDRLSSAYLDKFVNVKHRPDIIKRIKNMFGKLETDPSIIEFAEFVTFLVREYHNKGKDKHWERYDDLCYPCEIKYDVIAKLETATEDARFVLKNMTGAYHGNYTLPRTNARQNDNPPVHKTLSLFKTVPKETMLSLLELYKTDFDVFGYSFNTETLKPACKINSQTPCC